MLRGCILLCFFGVVFAQTCPKDKSKAESLYEKYCDPTEQQDVQNNNQSQGMMRSYNDLHNSQSRMQPQQKNQLNMPPTQSQPGYELPKPFEVPSRKSDKSTAEKKEPAQKQEESTWDYLN